MGWFDCFLPPKSNVSVRRSTYTGNSSGEQIARALTKTNRPGNPKQPKTIQNSKPAINKKKPPARPPPPLTTCSNPKKDNIKLQRKSQLRGDERKLSRPSDSPPFPPTDDTCMTLEKKQKLKQDAIEQNIIEMINGFKERIQKFEGEKQDPEFVRIDDGIRNAIVQLKNENETKPNLYFDNYIKELRQLLIELNNKADNLKDESENGVIKKLYKKLYTIENMTTTLQKEVNEFSGTDEKEYLYLSTSLMQLLTEVDKIDSVEYPNLKQQKKRVIKKIKQTNQILEMIKEFGKEKAVQVLPDIYREINFNINMTENQSNNEKINLNEERKHEKTQEMKMIDKQINSFKSQIKEFDGFRNDPQFTYIDNSIRSAIIQLKNNKSINSNVIDNYVANLRQLLEQLIMKANEEKSEDVIIKKLQNINKKATQLKLVIENFGGNNQKESENLEHRLIELYQEMDNIDIFKYSALRNQRKQVVKELDKIFDILDSKH